MSSSQAELDIFPKPTWQQDKGNHIRHKLSSSGLVIAMAVSEKYIVLSLDDRTIHVFTAAGEPLTVFRDYPQDAASLALQDSILLTGENNGAIRCWDLTRRELTRSLIGHTETVRCLKFAGAKTAVSASRDAHLKIWDLETGACQGTLSGHEDVIYALAITNDYAISGSKDGTAKVWSISEQKHMSTLSGHTGAVRRVECDGEKIFTGSLDNDVRVWDLTTGSPLAALKGHTSLVGRIAVHGDVLVTGGSDARIIIWSLQDYTTLHTIPEAHQYGITSMSARDGQILTGGSDGTVKLWDIKTGQLLGDLGTHTQSVWTVSLGAAETKTVIVASAQGTSPHPEWDDAFLDIWPLS